MFKVGIFPDTLGQDFEKALDVIVNEFGLKQLELRTMWDKNLVNLSESEVKKVEKMVKDKKLSACGIGSPFLKCKLTEEGKVDETDTFFAEAESYEEHLNILDHSIELAKRFNTNLVRCFGFWRQKLTPELWQEMIDKFNKAVKIAEKNNIVLVLENCPGLNISTGKEAKRLFEEIKSPNLRLLWDPDNSFNRKEIPYPDGYCLVKDYIGHVHVKDSVWDRKLNKAEPAPVGEGEIDWEGQFKALLNYNYEGVVSLESIYTPEGGDQSEGTRRSLKNLKKMLVPMGVCI